MKWTDNLRSVGRGLRLATRIAKGKLELPAFTLPTAAPTNPGPRAAAFRSDAKSHFVAFDGFGDNPGNLRMLANTPPIATGRPLVVLLHGCGQDAETFAADTGWTSLAERLRFPLILPVQASKNNAGRCFQWFQPSDTTRGEGEAASIANMARAAISRFDCDPRRVFVVGLSAGGAMTAALLAAYPDVFAAGASVAGLPVGAARSGMQAIMRMASAGPDQSPDAWAAQVRAAAPAGFAGPWPRLSVWQGQADTTVAPANGALLVTQWRALQGLTGPGVEDHASGGVSHQSWPDQTSPRVEIWSFPQLPHAYPIGTPIAAPGRFVEQAPVDATARIARFFGLD